MAGQHFPEGGLMNRKLKLSLICFLLVVLASHAFAEINLANLVKKIQPSIVTVITYNKEGKATGQGSGFFINRKGHVITNYHVIGNAHSAKIKTFDGKIYPVKSILAENEDMDLMKLSLDIPETLFKWLTVQPVLPTIAERIVVIGSPMGLEQTVSEGIVSGIREVPNVGKFIQISAPISPGSSGGPVANMKGEVVGVVTFYLLKGQNLNFAIPSQYLTDLKPFSRKPQQSRLFVHTEPEGARIRILNIKPKFYQGIILKPGRYHIEVSADGYEMEKVWIKVEPGVERNLKISLEKLPQLLTKDPDELVTIGVAYWKKGEFKKAIKPFKQAIRIDPDYAYAHLCIGRAYGELGRYTEAIDAAKQVIRIDPDYADAHYNLGYTYGKLGRYTEAIDAYKQAIRIDPDSAKVHYNLGITYLMFGAYGSALEQYKILKTLDKELANILLNLIYKQSKK